MSGLDRYQMPTLAEEREDEEAEYVAEQAIAKSDEWAQAIADHAYGALVDVLPHPDRERLMQVVYDRLCDDTSFMKLSEAAVRRDLAHERALAKCNGEE